MIFQKIKKEPPLSDIEKEALVDAVGKRWQHLKGKFSARTTADTKRQHWEEVAKVSFIIELQ